MMIKRTTYIFLILANILLFAHTIVPHHHHHKQVCLNIKHCINENIADDHVTHEKRHSHDGDNNSDDCVLKIPIISIFNQNKTEFDFYNNTTVNSGSESFYFADLINTAILKLPFSLTLVFEKSENRSFSSLFANSLGLRAPPVV